MGSVLRHRPVGRRAGRPAQRDVMFVDRCVSQDKGPPRSAVVVHAIRESITSTETAAERRGDASGLGGSL